MTRHGSGAGWQGGDQSQVGLCGLRSLFQPESLSDDWVAVTE